MKRLADMIGVLISIVLATLIVGEVVVRTYNPAPRRNVFRAEVAGPITMMEGVPTWRDGQALLEDRSAILEDTDCDGTNAFRVLVLGDSIFNGIDMKPHDVASVKLATALREELGAGRVCVQNLAVSGHSLYQTLARGRPALDSFKPHVVLLELWGGPPRIPIRNGGTLYLIEGSEAEAHAVYNPLGLPDAANHALMARSRFYEYAVLALPAKCPLCLYDLKPHEPLLDDFLDRVTAHGASLVTFMPAYLFHPMDAQPQEATVAEEGYLAWIERRSVHNVKLWDAWVGTDPATIRLDNCHLNPLGHEMLATVFRREVQPALDAWTAAQRPVDPAAPEASTLAPEGTTPAP